MHFEGDFSSRESVPQIIDSLNKMKLTGILRFKRKTGSVKVFVKDGDAVYASGPETTAVLGRTLHRKGLVTANRLKAAIEHAKQKRVVLPQALLDKEAISQEDLHKEIKDLFQQTMEELLSWDNGCFEYVDAGFDMKELYPGKRRSQSDVMKERIARSVRVIPPMPEVIMKARKIMADPKSDIKQLAKVLETDQGIAARILRLANSPYYGMSGRIGSIDRAMVVLGHEALGEIISMASISVFSGRNFKGYGLTGEDMWRHSVSAAAAAKIIAGKVRPYLAEEAFAAGLIHDAGKMVLDKFIRENQEAFNTLLDDPATTTAQAEKKVLGWDHCEIAGQVCKSWKAPEKLAQAVMHHHNPRQAPAPELACIIHLADGMAHVCAAELGCESRPMKLDKWAVRHLGLSTLEMNTIMVMVQEAVQKARETAME